ncbi:MAG: HEPN domain-containing protein [candidate division WOR-3 bacterium]
MTSQEMAESYIQTAAYIMKQAKMAHADNVWHLTVRRCQECVEMALKGALRLVGVEVPKMHDVGFVLREHKDAFPEWFKAEIDRAARISRSLRGEREMSLYGDDQLALPPEVVFTKLDADEALRDADSVLSFCESLFQESRRRDDPAEGP